MIKNLKEKILTNVDLQIITFVFMIILMDIYKLFIDAKIQIFNFSLIEIIKILLLWYLFIITIISKRDKIKEILKNHKKLCFGIILCYLIFIIFHSYSILSFDKSIINNYSDSLLTEFYYIFRTYGLCLVLFMIVLLSDIKSDKIIKLISFFSFIVCLIIVVSNILKIGYVAYSSYLESERIIEGSIFDWFSKLNTTNADLFTTKGLFYSTNQLSIVILSTIIISALYLITTKKKVLFFTFPIKILSALMIATKTCSLGVILVLIILIICNPIYNKISHQKIDIPATIYFLLILLIYIPLFSIAPANYKLQIFVKNSSNNIDNNETPPVSEEELNEILVGDDKESFIKMLEKGHNYFGIHEDYIEVYPIEKNYDFWKQALNLPDNERLDFRNFKEYMYRYAIKQNRDEVTNYLFGIGYVSNFPYIEKDFIGQIAWFGIFGTICLIGPYIVLFMVALILIFRNFDKNFTLKNIYIFIAIMSCIAASLIAGHLFGNLFPMAIFILLLKSLFDLIMNNNELNNN